MRYLLLVMEYLESKSFPMIEPTRQPMYRLRGRGGLELGLKLLLLILMSMKLAEGIN